MGIKLKGITCNFRPTSCGDQLAKALEEIKSIPTELKSSEKIISYTAELSQKRNQVDSLQITASETGAYFTKTIGSIINITTIVPNTIDDKDSRNIIQVDTHLASMKEQLGQLRANLNATFTKNNFVENDYFNFAVSFGAFNINKNKYCAKDGLILFLFQKIYISIIKQHKSNVLCCFIICY